MVLRWTGRVRGTGIRGRARPGRGQIGRTRQRRAFSAPECAAGRSNQDHHEQAPREQGENFRVRLPPAGSLGPRLSAHAHHEPAPAAEARAGPPYLSLAPAPVTAHHPPLIHHDPTAYARIRSDRKVPPVCPPAQRQPHHKWTRSSGRQRVITVKQLGPLGSGSPRSAPTPATNDRSFPSWEREFASRHPLRRGEPQTNGPGLFPVSGSAPTPPANPLRRYPPRNTRPGGTGRPRRVGVVRSTARHHTSPGRSAPPCRTDVVRWPPIGPGVSLSPWSTLTGRTVLSWRLHLPSLVLWFPPGSRTRSLGPRRPEAAAIGVPVRSRGRTRVTVRQGPGPGGQPVRGGAAGR
jgi:hypothetical protein